MTLDTAPLGRLWTRCCLTITAVSLRRTARITMHLLQAIRDEVVPALQRIASSSNDDDGLIRTSLQLISWYLNAPISRRPSVGSALIESGVLQLVLQLALRRSIPQESNGAISQCWEWLLHACLRFSCVSRFVSQAILVTIISIEQTEHCFRSDVSATDVLA